MRSRLSVTGGTRFAWRQGDKVHLYGLDRLQDARRAGWVLIVEGESDCWTAWHHDLPGVGVPGKSTWSGERRARVGCQARGTKVYLWEEPDAEDLTAAVGKDVPDLHVIVAPEGVKDLSEAHVAAHDIPAYVETLKAAAVAFAELSGARHDDVSSS